MSARALCAALLILGLGCALVPFRSGVRSCPAALASPAELGPDFTRRYRYRVENAAGERFGVDLVVEKRGEELVVVGLTPLGATAFALRQRPGDVEVVEHVRPLFPPPPANALADLSRAGLLRSERRADRTEATLSECGYRATLRPIE